MRYAILFAAISLGVGLLGLAMWKSQPDSSGRTPIPSVPAAGADSLPAVQADSPAEPGGDSATLSQAEPADPHSIQIENFTFRPSVLTVPAGTRVTWVNVDDVPHTATSNDKTFASGTLDTDDTFSFVFNEPGDFEYFCAVHRHMTGKVIVTK